MAAQLEAGIAVADVGCGHGHSTVLMAEAFPRSRFFGSDAHAESVAQASRHAAAAGVAQRADFAMARAVDYPDRGYGLICFFDTLLWMRRQAALVHEQVSLTAGPSAKLASRDRKVLQCRSKLAEGDD